MIYIVYRKSKILLMLKFENHARLFSETYGAGNFKMIRQKFGRNTTVHLGGWVWVGGWVGGGCSIVSYRDLRVGTEECNYSTPELYVALYFEKSHM
jgi:hypothetical protein